MNEWMNKWMKNEFPLKNFITKYLIKMNAYWAAKNECKKIKQKWEWEEWNERTKCEKPYPHHHESTLARTDSNRLSLISDDDDDDDDDNNNNNNQQQPTTINNSNNNNEHQQSTTTT